MFLKPFPAWWTSTFSADAQDFCCWCCHAVFHTSDTGVKQDSGELPVESCEPNGCQEPWSPWFPSLRLHLHLRVGNSNLKWRNFWGASWNIRGRLEDIFSDVSWQLGLGWMCLYEDKGGAVRDQAALSGPQLGLMAAEHRLRLALIWMSTRRLVLFLPASLCALPRFAVCQRIALAASSSHAKVINKHLQMAPNNSLQSDTAQSVQASSAEPVQEPFRSSPGRPAEPKRFCSSRSLWAQNISANGRRAQWMKMRMQAAGVDSPETCSAPSVGVERR